MKPINQAERRKAFLNFLLFFILTLSVVVIAVLSSVQVPFKENEKLRNEMNVVQNEKAILKSFEVWLQQTMNLLDTVNMAKNDYVIENRISNNIKEMNGLLNDSISINSFCNKVLENLTSLQVAKKQLRDINNSNEELVKKDQTIESLKHQVELYQIMIQNYNQSSR